MEVRALIEKFKDKNDIMNLDIVTGMVVYGSRINHFDSDISDLDILLITNGNNCYKGGQYIEGIKIELGIYSVDKLLSLIYEDKVNNNRFFPSVFNTGLVEKNVDNIVGSLKEFANEQFIGSKEKRLIDREVKNELQKMYKQFKITKDSIYEDFNYFNLLELIRNTYLYRNRLSRLAFTKVYDLYNDSRLNTYYQLKLPPLEFTSTFITALSAKGFDVRLKIIDELLKMLGLDPYYFSLSHDSFKVWDIEDFTELEYRIIYLCDKIRKVEDMLITNHPSKMYVYHITLNRLRDLIMLINAGDFSEVNDAFEYANKVKTDNERIEALEKLFSHIEQKFNLDYNNYLVKRY